MDEHASVAREFNRHVLEPASRAEAFADDTLPLGLLCECGCMTIVEMSIRQYDEAGAAFRKGHAPSPVA